MSVAALAAAALAALPAAATAAPVPLAQVGSPGSGAGQLDDPYGIALDDAGNLHVADTNNHRISVFSPTGAFIRAFGYDVVPGGGANFEVCTTASGCKAGIAGAGAGQFTFPEDVALDGAGKIYVADTFNHRISVFSPTGAFIRASGWGVATGAAAFEVCTTASGCQAGIAGGGAGQFTEPEGVALDGAGDLYVVDTDNDRVSVFSSAPSFTRAFGWGVDTGAAAFEVCTTVSGCQAGIPGGGAGQLSNPIGITFDDGGNLYVGDYDNHRVSVFSSAPSFTRAFGWGVDSGAAAFEVCTTVSGCQPGVLGGGAGQLGNPSGVALDGAGHLQVADQYNNRISMFDPTGVFLHAYGYDVIPDGVAGFEVCTTLSGCKAGIDGAGAGQIATPLGLGVDCRGAVWVAERVNDRLERFGEPGTALPPCLGPEDKVEGSATAKKTQRQKGNKLIVKVTAGGSEQLNVVAKGTVKTKARAGGSRRPDAATNGKAARKLKAKLGPERFAVPAGEKKARKLRSASRQAQRIAKALRKGGKATAKLEVKLTDQEGNKKTEKLEVKLKR